jgi:hypothetical protein
MADMPFPHMASITLTFNMPCDYTPAEREKLAKAAGRCPIKGSFRPETSSIAKFLYASGAGDQQSPRLAAAS